MESTELTNTLFGCCAIFFIAAFLTLFLGSEYSEYDEKIILKTNLKPTLIFLISGVICGLIGIYNF